MPAFLFHGDDDFSLREALSALRESLGDPDLVALNTSTLEGRSLTFAELQSHAETIPFLAPARLVIVEGLFARFAPRGRAAANTATDDTPDESDDAPAPAMDGAWSGLADLLTRMPDTTTLAFIEPKPVGVRNPLLRAAGKSLENRTFSPMKGAQLVGWIQDRARRTGSDIAPKAAALLADLVGDNLWSVASEIDKLGTYALNRQITEADVSNLTVGAKEASIFALVDAIVARNLPLAGRTLHQLLDDGAAAPYIIFMIARQMRALLLAKDLIENNRNLLAADRLSEPEIGKRIGVTHPFALQKTMTQARNATMQQLSGAHHRILDADLSLKTGKLDGDLSVELLVVDLCRAPAPAARAGAR